MKKPILCVLFGAVFLVLMGIAGVADASMVQWTDTWDVGPISFSGSNSSYSYQHNIRANGFVVGQDEVHKYGLRISLWDDSRHDGWEWALIDLPGHLSDAVTEVDFDDITLGFSAKGLSSLNSSGLLDVSIYGLWGDFQLRGSQIVAWSESPSTPIPPSVLLLASGLVGIVGYRKRLKKQTAP